MGKVSDVFMKGANFLKKNAPTLEMCFSGSFAILGGATLCLFAPEIASVTEHLQQMAKDGAPKSKIAKEAVVGYSKYAGLGFACEVASIILAAHSKATVESRLNAVAASLAAVTASYSAYRDRVVKDQGADKDFEYYTGEKVNSTVTVDMSTNETKEEKNVVPSKELAEELKEGKRTILHTFVFDETNPGWHGNKEADINYLYNELAAANRALSHYGYMFDNDIFKCFSAPLTKSGQAAGAMRDWPDGTVEHKLRLNPVWLQGFLNGTQDWCVCELQYDDSTPLHDNIIPYRFR